MNNDNIKLKDVYTNNYNYYKEFGTEGQGVASVKACDDVTKAITEHMSELVDVTNSSVVSYDMVAEGIVKGITSNHRTLQNEFMISLVKAIQTYGNLDENQYDPRNEWAVKDCKVMSDAIDEARK